MVYVIVKAVGLFWSSVFDALGGIGSQGNLFLREASLMLTYANVEIYLRLSQGEELPFARGKRGKALDDAIIEYEQQVLQRIIDSNLIFGTSVPISRKAPVLNDINASFGNLSDRLLGNKCIKEAMANAFPSGGFEFASMADRVALGKALGAIERSPAQAACKQ